MNDQNWEDIAKEYGYKVEYQDDKYVWHRTTVEEVVKELSIEVVFLRNMISELRKITR